MIASARLETSRVLRAELTDGREVRVPVADLPFATGPEAVGVEVVAGGDAVKIAAETGDWEVLADELADATSAEPLRESALAERIGQRIRRARHARGLLLRDLEALTGIQVPNLSALEAGRSLPRLDTLHRIAAALDVSVAFLAVRGAATDVVESALSDEQVPITGNRWWAADPAERFWIELSYRDDFGVDLNAPTTDERGREHHSYFLITEVKPGDVVFHYSNRENAITGWSRVTGRAFRDEVVWGPQAGPMATRPAPHLRPGWRVGLEGAYPVEPVVFQSDLRADEARIADYRNSLRARTRGPLYFPFELSDRRPLRAAQFYLAKLPAALVDLFPSLAAAAVEADSTAVGVTVAAPPLSKAAARGMVGRAYQARPAPSSSSPLEPWTVDPDVLDRGRTGHWATQEELAAHVRRIGGEPREAEPDEPKYDVAWDVAGTIYVAEVKSTTKKNEESQLRLGLGQVLRYRHLLGAATGKPVRAVLAVEHPPADDRWDALCHSLDVVLIWPEVMDRLGSSAARSRPVPRPRPGVVR